MDIMAGKELRTLLSGNIRALRHDKGWSQAELAEKAGVSIPFLSQIEIGKKWPHPDSLAKIGEALNVQIYELFRGENEMMHDVRGVISKLTGELTALLDSTSEHLKKNYSDKKNA
jgi:transcriptional regulator with XRE-family HTH domain